MNKRIVNNIVSAVDCLNTINWSQVAFDFETKDVTYPERWAHGGDYEAGRPTGVSFCDGKNAVYIDTCGWSDYNMEFFIEGLKQKLKQSKLLIGHNIVFDLGVFHKYTICVDDYGFELYDTMTAAHLIDENRKYKGGLGLKHLAVAELGYETVREYDGSNQNKEDFQQYGLYDAIYTHQLAQKFSVEMEKEGVLDLFRKIEMPFQKVLLEMDIAGVPINQPKAKKILDNSERVLVEYESELYDIMGTEHEIVEEGGVHKIKLAHNEEAVNFNSNMQVTPILLDRGLELTEKTPTGRYSLAGDILEEFKDDEFVEVLIKYKQLKHLMGHFISKLPEMVDSDGRMRPRWKNVGTVTGRLSSSKPNFQNLPRPDNDPVGIRDCVAVEEGKTLFGCDYSGQEIAVLAHVSQDPVLVERINNGFDLHLSMANDFQNLGIPEELLIESHPKYADTKKKYSEERTKAKIITFGLSYGKSAYGFAKDFDISEEEGQQILDDYFTMFPLVKKAIDSAREYAEKQGYVRQYYGRKRRFEENKWGRRDDRALRQAFNFLIQSPSADMIRKASVNCYNTFREHPEWEAKIIMSIHDEIIVEGNEEYEDEIAQAMEEQFINATDDFEVQFRADVAIGKTYAECK